MSTHELPSIFPLEISDQEQRLGFCEMILPLGGLIPSGDDSTGLRLVGRTISASDVLLKMIWADSIRYRHMRYGYRKFLGFRLPWTRTEWQAASEPLYTSPDIDVTTVSSNVVGVPFQP